MATYRGTNGNDTVNGSVFTNNTFLDFGLGADIINGGALNDRIQVKYFDAKLDAINGGTGTDTVDLSIMQLATQGTSLKIILGEGSSTGYISTSYFAGSLGSLGFYTKTLANLTSIENITGSRYADNITGNKAANILDGGFGNDTIHGGGGNDTLFGGEGNDILNGGTGKNSVNGGIGDDHITHTLDRPTLSGDRDYIDGGEGTDTLYIDFGGRTYEKVTISLSTEFAPSQNGFPEPDRSIDTGFISSTYSLNSSTTRINGEAVITGIENVVGSSGDDIIIGDRNGNILRGGDGDDLLSGETGLDKLFGDAGNDTFEAWNDGAPDTIDGGSGIDTIDYSRSTKQVIVSLQEGTASVLGDMFNFVLEDTISNVENIIGSKLNDYIRGNAVGNELFGGDGNDTILGYDGDDIIDGGRGADKMTGGVGADIFRLWNFTEDSGPDRITDFQTGVDKIDLSGFFSRQDENHWINDDALEAEFIGNGQFTGGYQVRTFIENGITVVQFTTGLEIIEVDVQGQVFESDFIY